MDLNERDAQLVLMGNIGCRRDGWREAEPLECEALVARDLLKSGPALLGTGQAYYPTPLGKEVAVRVYAAGVSAEDKAKILEREAWHKIPDRLRHLYDFIVSDGEPDGEWTWYEQPVYALNDFGKQVAQELQKRG